jgi:PAS domain S-box-containing protein
MATLDPDPARSATPVPPAEQYEALRQIATAVANGADPASVFRLVAEGAAGLVNADGCGVVRFDDDGLGRLVGRWARPGLVPSRVPTLIPLDGPTAVAQVARTGVAARVSAYEQMDDERARYLASMYRTGVAVPVRLGTGLWGAVAVGVAGTEALAEDTEERLADFAELVALAVASPDPKSRDGIEELLDTLLSSAPVGLAFFDRELRFVRVNTALAQINGRHADEHIGRTLREVDERLGDELMGVLARVRDEGVPVLDLPVSGETPAQPGVLRNWLTSYYPVRSEHGGVLGVGAVVVEVTEAKRAEEELRRERDYSAALIEAMQDGLAVATPDGTLVDVNHRFCEMTGFAGAELLGSSPPYPYWPEGNDRRAVEDAFERAFQGHTGEHDLVFRRRSGRPLPVVVAHAPLRDADGELRGFVATVRDVTQKRRADQERSQLLASERAARDRTELLQSMTASLSTALTPDQVLDVAVGPAFDAVGAPRGSVMLVDGGSLVPARSGDLQTDGIGVPTRIPLDRASPLAAVARTGTPAFYASRLELGADYPQTLDRVRTDTQALAVVPLALEDRTLGVLAFAFPEPRLFPVTDRALFATVGVLCGQALERARLYARSRANENALRQRDALKSTVLRGVSHEFRSPLTAIANAAEALHHVADPGERRDLLGVVGAETRRLDRLVVNLLDLSRLEGGALQPRLDWCSPAELVAGALEAAATLTTGSDIEVDIPAELPFLRADPVLTERILLNLLHNAVRHGLPPIRIEVRVAAESIDVAVVDCGPGVLPAVRESIFEPFVGAADRGGIGLGLGLSRGLAEAQGGRLRLDPTDRGARFVLSLPIDDWVEL